MSRDPTSRFSDRVESYVRARPDYPAEALAVIRSDTGLAGALVVADVGSGTGIFSRRLLDHGHTVYAVEPNAPMREAAEEALSGNPRFHSVAGRAEATTLPDACVDLVTAAQAFHWFEPEATREEWRRVLKPPGWVALLWNERVSSGGPFLEDYEAFLQEWGTDYREVRSTWVVGEKLDRFFAGGSWTERLLPSEQALDLEGLRGRVLSSSYMPSEGPRLGPMMRALERLFREHEEGGQVRMAYHTRVCVGALAPHPAR